MWPVCVVCHGCCVWGSVCTTQCYLREHRFRICYETGAGAMGTGVTACCLVLSEAGVIHGLVSGLSQVQGLAQRPPPECSKARVWHTVGLQNSDCCPFLSTCLGGSHRGQSCRKDKAGRTEPLWNVGGFFQIGPSVAHPLLRHPAEFSSTASC